MIKIQDVAAYILNRYGRMTTMKLQKLCFYVQSAYLAETGEPLFDEDFYAWVNGPVSPDLFALHRGKFFIYPGDLAADTKVLKAAQIATINTACDGLSQLSSNALTRQVQGEKPWIDGRGGCDYRSKPTRPIPKSALRSTTPVDPAHWSSRDSHDRQES